VRAPAGLQDAVVRFAGADPAVVRDAPKHHEFRA
jgi:hypothetical protein